MIARLKIIVTKIKFNFVLLWQFLMLPINLINNFGGIKSTARRMFDLYQRKGIGGFLVVINNIIHGVVNGHSEQLNSYKRNRYPEWLIRYDSIDNETREKMLSKILKMEKHPLVTIVMPTYNSNIVWLSQAIDSVLGQMYENWELCIADDASTDPEVQKILEKYSTLDSRIKIEIRNQNGHISAASNSALKLATGDWIALLDHDDLLHETALFWVVDCINQNPDAMLIYSDEDKINEKNVRSGPYFKTDWNRNLFYSHNMICHLGVYSKRLVDEVGGFREGYEGAQDYDLALRCIENIEDRQICHIPRILYHWRAHVQSTAHQPEAKPYAMLAGERAINEHFQRTGVLGHVKLMNHGYRPYYDLPNPPPLISLIIPTRNGLNFLRNCIQSIILKTNYSAYEIVIVDNGSDDPETLKYLESLCNQKNIQVIRNDDAFNYSALNNLGVSVAKGELIGLINNDIEVISPDWLNEMVANALRPGIGVVGAKLLYPNGTLQHAGVILGIGGWAGHSHKGFPKSIPGYAGRTSLVSEFSAVTGACLVIKKETYQRLGGLNAVDLKVACNDVDLCLGARALGLRNIWTPYAELFHHESVTRGYEDDPIKKARFAAEVSYMRNKWGDIFKNDPMYSPNLTLDYEDFSYAWPPRVAQI